MNDITLRPMFGEEPKNTILIYHSTNVIIENPHIVNTSYFKDFGYGFYTTEIRNQAEKWTRKKNPKIVNIYDLDLAYKKELNNKVFISMTEDWLDFIAFCRSGGSHSYDTVEGPMADDTVFTYVDDFLSGLISREAFWELCKFKYPTHQLVFNTDKSLEYLKFKEYYYYV